MLRQIRTIARKELRTAFGSPLALIFLGTFLVAVMFIVFTMETFFVRNVADIRPLFVWMPILLIFLLGLAADMLHNTPLGVHALTYMLLTLVAKSQAAALSGLSFLFHWGLFALAMTGFGAVKFLISLIGTPQVFDHSLRPAILQVLQLVLTTILAYPFGHLVFSGLNRGLLKPPNSL